MDVIQFFTTWLSIIFLLVIFCDALERRQLGRIKGNKIIIV
jgi:hypothetical protein